jgi:hypothetical protein
MNDVQRLSFVVSLGHGQLNISLRILAGKTGRRYPPSSTSFLLIQDDKQHRQRQYTATSLHSGNRCSVVVL